MRKNKLIIWQRNTDWSGLLSQVLEVSGFDTVLCDEPEGAKAVLTMGCQPVVLFGLGSNDAEKAVDAEFMQWIRMHYPNTRLLATGWRMETETTRSVMQKGVTMVFDLASGLEGLLAFVADMTASGVRLDQGTKTKPNIQHVPSLDTFLAENTLRAKYQPIVQLNSVESPYVVYGCESLARTTNNSPLGNPGLLFSYGFFKGAYFQLDMACITAALIGSVSLPHSAKLFLNVQPRTLCHAEFTEQLYALVAQSGRHPRDVVIEITESRPTFNPERFNATLATLKEYGFLIAIDDFGEGFANYELVIDTDPHIIKLSGVLCRGIERSQFKQDIVGSVCRLAKSRGIKTVAEFIETEDTAEHLHQLGADLGQGWCFSKAISINEFLASPRFRLAQDEHLFTQSAHRLN